MQSAVCLIAHEDEITKEIRRLSALIPPPLSLNVVCAVTGRPPIGVLQIFENLVNNGYLSRYEEKGAGYYYLSDFKSAQNRLRNEPQSQVFEVAQKAVTGICSYMPDNLKQWLTLANIYYVSGLPIKHFREVIKAGHYCLHLNLPQDAARYYRRVLEAMEQAELTAEEKDLFIDAAINLCVCQDTALSRKLQRRFLGTALCFAKLLEDPVRVVNLTILIGKTYLRTSHSNEAEEHLDEASLMLKNLDLPSDLRIKMALANSELYFERGYITRSIECYESVLGSHEELPSDMETLKGFIRMGWVYGVAGETPRGTGLIRAVRKKAKELGAEDLERYATLIMAVVLSDARRIDEGEVFLKKVFEAPTELLDHWTLWPGNGKRAFFAYCRGNFEDAFKFQDMAWQNAKAIEVCHHKGADNIEVMLGLEERGMVHSEWNFDYDTKRLMDWPDIYMQGIAYRFMALRAYRKKAPLSQVKTNLRKSLGLLNQAGAKIELAHSQVLMARVYIDEKKLPKAERLLKKAWVVFGKINPKLFPKDLKPYLDKTSKNALWVNSLLKVSNALSAVRNREDLLNKIIKQAMQIAGAERGGIFLGQQKNLELVASRNLNRNEISSNSFAEQMTLIEKVLTSGKEVIQKPATCNNDNDLYIGDAGWTGGFPIRLQSKVLGVIFMDRGPTNLQFPEDEVALLRIISNQVAVALDNMNAYEEIIDLNQELEAEAHFYRQRSESDTVSPCMIGKSDAFKKLLSMIKKVAASDTTVMITGETGVGKDLVAQAIHNNSNRAGHPFIAVNLVSLSPELIASELFGHEKGAFTGAANERKGRFELTNRGTLFLDDIDAFSLDIQVKMLRVLETRQFERVGGTTTLKTNFRLLASSNRNLEELVAKGLFRSDFYYRLNVFPIHIPPLRERKEDIPALTTYFLKKFGKKFGKRFDSIARRDMEILMNYPWPGNIRELRHVIERAALLSRDGHLSIPDLNAGLSTPKIEEESVLSFKEMETRHILKVLNLCQGKISGKGGAAELLDLNPATLYSKMRRLGIKKDAYRRTPAR